MKFCVICENMYYIKIKDTDENQLTYYCRNCGHVDETISDEGICVLNVNLKEGNNQTYEHIINQYTKLDPTLPRIYNMKCPNANCKTNENHTADDTSSTQTEIIYIRYNDIDMKYIYLCVECDYVWKNDDNN